VGKTGETETEREEKRKQDMLHQKTEKRKCKVKKKPDKGKKEGSVTVCFGGEIETKEKIHCERNTWPK